MHKSLSGYLLFLFFSLSLISVNAQRVYYPTGSQGEYETMKAGVMGFQSYRANLQEQAYFRHYTLHDTSSGKVLEQIEIAGWYFDEHFRYLSTEELRIKSKKSWKKIYEYPSAFYAKKAQDYLFVINPVFDFYGGKEAQDSHTLYHNTRGVEIWGNIGGLKKGIGYYTYFTENQIAMPQQYASLPDSLNYVPHELAYKKFKTTGVDFFQARGYITFNALKGYINFRFGHDKNKIGNGYRSLILSDFAPQYLFLKINTNVGRVHYQNLFTQFTDNGPIMTNTLYGKKYAAFNRLSVDVTDGLNIGVNEMVVFDRMDSTQLNQFELNYLNPVIFYRSIEANMGSRDNALLALDFNWSFCKRYLIYGQLIFDEFKLHEFKDNKNWWGNKYGYQIGARAFNLLGVKNLDLLAEYNRVRPYTYSHSRTTQSYSHFNQALAHPLGANFEEGIVEIKYKPSYKFYVTLTGIFARQGRDTSLNGRNYGSNILKSYDTRVTNENAFMFMGKSENLMLYEVLVSYMVMHNTFIDLRYNYRSFGKENNSFYGIGLRMNCNLRQYNF